MDIQIRKQLEQLEYIKDKLEYIEYSESLQCYVEKLNGIPTFLNGVCRLERLHVCYLYCE